MEIAPDINLKNRSTVFEHVILGSKHRLNRATFEELPLH